MGEAKERRSRSTRAGPSLSPSFHPPRHARSDMAARELSPLLSYKQVNRHPDKKGGSEAIPSQGVRLARALAASGATTLADPAFSLYQDHADPFDYARREFQFPKKEVVWPERFKFSTAKGAAEGQEACVYLAGNSLGLMPRNVGELILQELDVWRTR